VIVAGVMVRGSWARMMVVRPVASAIVTGSGGRVTVSRFCDKGDDWQICGKGDGEQVCGKDKGEKHCDRGDDVARV